MKQYEATCVSYKNPAKVRRYLMLLSNIKRLNLLSLADFPATVSVDEPFLTAEENARHKAREYSRMLNECVLTIDEALYVDLLPEEEQPGVYVRRIDKSTEAADQEIYDYWKRKIDEVCRECRGYFRQSLCICTVEGLLFERTVDRHFLFGNSLSPYFSPGYPFSTLCLVTGVQKVYSELSDTEKIVVDRKDLACVYDLVSDFLSAEYFCIQYCIQNCIEISCTGVFLFHVEHFFTLVKKYMLLYISGVLQTWKMFHVKQFENKK